MRARVFWSAGAALVASLATFAFAEPARETARQALRDGERLWRLKRTRSALEAFEKAAARKELAAEAQYQIGRIYFFKGWEAEGAFPGWHEEVEYRVKALAAFEAALKIEPALAGARHGRWKALRGLGRDAGPEPTLPPEADAGPAEQIHKLRVEKKYGELIEPASRFVARFPESEWLPAVYDALLEAYQETPTTDAGAIASAIEARIAARPDPAAYFTGANLLLLRGDRLERARSLAREAVPAAETFVNENLDSYKLAEKARGSLNRARATSADLEGWALFKQADDAAAEVKLREADRLSRSQDFSSQLHLGELLAKKGAVEEATERYLNALSLAGGAEAQRAAARQSLSELAASQGRDPAGFEAWLKEDLDRHRSERRDQLLRSMVDRPLPALPLVSLTGQPVDLEKLRGQVLLFNFFASW